MAEPIIISKFLAIVGGTATLIVIGTIFGMYHNWLQTKEYEHHTGLLVRIAYDIRMIRKKVEEDGSS